MLGVLNSARLLQLLIDVGVTIGAVPLAYVLRLDDVDIDRYIIQGLTVIPIAIGIRTFWRFVFGLHRPIWRFTGIREAIEIAAAITAGTVCLVLLSRFGFEQRIPLGVLANEWWLTLFGYVGVRLLRRHYAERRPTAPGNAIATRVLLVGAGQAGNLVAKEINQHSPHITIVGFVDDDPQKRRSRMQGGEVLGTFADIPHLVESQLIDEVLVCIPSAPLTALRRVVELSRTTKAKIKTIPGIRDLLSGRATVSQFRDVQIEDLLNRDPVEMDRNAAGAYIGGRVVMVTGAGGSIGSELCRQIATLGPSRLLLVGRGEFSVYTIDQEMRETFPSLEVIPIIADVRDMGRMARIFEQNAPDVVFHAAAHKHVPLMERNPSEAIINNIFGTRIVAQLAEKHGAETFVFVSTDKAVNPTNVMGASKRVAEMIVQDLATRSQTRFMAVRFGNVLGSRGSVIPLFKRQIAMGGPITLTHPDIIRYFMTIPEAAQLVLQAGAAGQGGELFVLDMGEPVKIADVARDLIQLSGLVPDVDIKIKFTGLRPGEKLYEELLTAEEGTQATRFRKIHIARPEPVDRERLESGLVMLHAAAMAGDDPAIRRGLKALVTTYHTQKVD